MTRLRTRFHACAASGRAALVIFVMAGDPNPELSAEILGRLPAAGADVIELGIPFSDPIGDGPSVQRAAKRALGAGMTLQKTLDMVHSFRLHDKATPLTLMGYFNSACAYGKDFVADARDAGVDGLMIVDLPPEQDPELCDPALAAGLDWIRFVTPTTDDQRLPKLLHKGSGFLYYVSVTGVSGSRVTDFEAVRSRVAWLRSRSVLPVAVGFGIRSPEDVALVAEFADGVVVGSAIADTIESAITDQRGESRIVEGVEALVRDMHAKLRSCDVASRQAAAPR